jgi:hypothetical protein
MKMVSPSVAESCQGDIDNIRSNLAELLISKSPVLHNPRAIVLDNDIGDRNHPLDQVQAFLRTGVHGDAELISIRVVELSGRVEIDLNAWGRGASS